LDKKQKFSNKKNGKGKISGHPGTPASAGKKWNEKFMKYQAVLLFFFAFLLYANTLSYDYVLDDGLVIKTNTFTLKGFGGIGDILTHDQFAGVPGAGDNAIYKGGRYRPLSQVAFAVEYQLFGLNPFAGHLINALVYGLLAIVIFFLLGKIFHPVTGKPWYNSVPFIATAIFIAHPLHTEVVANIKSRDELMGMLGGILTLLYSLKFVETKKVLNLLLSFVFFFLGLLSKESVFTFIAIVPLTLFVIKKATAREYALVLSPLIAASVIYFCIRFFVIGNTTGHAVAAPLFHDPFMYATLSEKYATIMLTWLKYMILLLFPHPLTHDYYPKQVPIINWSDLRSVLTLLISLALIIYSVMKIRKKDRIAYGILFFMITFSVTSNLFFDLGLFMNERFMFTPLLGFAIVAAVLIQKIRVKRLLNSVILIILLLYSVKTISRNQAWMNDYTLFTTDVETSVNSGRCNAIAGSQILEKARVEKDTAKQHEMYIKAEYYLQRGVNIYAVNREAWNNLGEVQIYLGKYKDAISSLEFVFTMDSLNPNALNNLSYIANKYEQQHLYKESIGVYKLLMKQDPSEYIYVTNIAGVYRDMNKVDTAIMILDDVIRRKPDYYEAYNRIAEYYAVNKNDYEHAISYLDKAYEKDPKYQPTLENLGVIYGLRSDYKRSLSYFIEAYHIDSAKVNLCSNIGRTYELLGDKTKANEYYQKAKTLAQKK
jgi:protein O-mannosyl-transferase